MRSITAALICFAMLGPTGAAEPSAADFSRFTRAAPVANPGQSRTLLPDGRWLFVGGVGEAGASVFTKAEREVAADTEVSQLTAQLMYPRLAHTSTVLPDGTVLILGGVDATGALVSAAEVFDPATGEITVILDSGLTPRSHHTATLLTEGYVLVTGGASSDGTPLQEAELWNPDTQRVESVSSALLTPRARHSAALLSNGKGLIWGGLDGSGRPLGSGEIYDPASTVFSAVGLADPALPSTALRDVPPAMEASIPQENATDAPVDSRIAIRFSKHLQVRSVSAQSVTLVGPAGAVAGKVVAAGDGMLVFFIPYADLLPNATYTVFLRGLLDDQERSLPWSAFKFTTRSLNAPNTSSGSGSITIDFPSSASETAGPTIDGERREDRKKEDERKRDEKDREKKPTVDDDFEDWIPGEHHRHGRWRVLGTRNEPRTSKVLLRSAPLKASAKNVTAIAGRVVRLNGLPLEGVTIRAGNVTTLTDAQGRFILAGVHSGVQEITIDGSAVTSGGRRYATHFIRVQASSKRTITLDQPIYISRLNPAHDIAIASPADKDLVLNHPDIPGLELHIPKGAVLRTRDGRIITKLNITPLPVDRVPFAVPEGFPVYFTIQPAGAFVDGTATGTAAGARVIYPNYLDAPAGTRMTFWNYDPSGLGWQVYGRGTVSANGKQVIPDEDVEQRNFMAFGYAFDNSDLSPPGPPPGGQCMAADPVDCSTGLFIHEVTDFRIADTVPLTLTRTYRPNDPESRDFGIGTNHTYALLLSNPTPANSVPPLVYLVLPDGGRVGFTRVSGTSLQTAVYQHLSTPTAWQGATLRINASADSWEITRSDQAVLSFTAHAPNVLTGIRDRHGNVVQIRRATEGGRISQIRSPNGRTLSFVYDAANRIASVRDNIDRVVKYEYDASGRLSKVIDPNGNAERYQYDAQHRMTSVIDKRGNTMMTNVYDANGRVVQQTLADGAIWSFDYTLSSSGKVAATAVTNPRGHVSQMAFNADGYVVQVIDALGQPEQRAQQLVRENRTNNIVSRTDPLGRVSRYSYDHAGNITSETRLYGTAAAVTTSATFDPLIGRMTSYSNGLQHRTDIQYDSSGNLIAIVDPLNRIVRMNYDETGRPVEIINPLGKSTHLSYDSGDLSTVTDALGRATTMLADAAGRRIAVVNPSGARSSTEYDALDRVLRSVDARGAATQVVYDENGNVRALRDPRDLASHQFTYDVCNRLETYTDPLGRTEQYQYDAAGNLISIIDRKGQVTSRVYDALDRLRMITYPDGSTVTLVWDAGDRIREINDSAKGVITRDYDALDRLTHEATTQGQVDYSYDDAGRRTQMTVLGQTPVNYYYDEADQLTQIARGDVTVDFTYDAEGQRATTVLPNGVVRTHSFDDAGQLLSIVYDRGPHRVADVSYQYSVDGWVIAESGSLAKLHMPPNVASASYDVANRVVTWSNRAAAYDDNGNMTELGEASFSWNARNELIGASEGSGIFTYDALGRRTGRSIDGSVASYLYDGATAVLVNGDTILSGLGLDEIYARIDASGATTLLTDALGSVRMLLDESGNPSAQYSYSPFGTTSKTGGTDTPFQFTGRENDGPTNLYHHRARYYRPEMGRFISEDPLGVSGIDNVYNHFASYEPVLGRYADADLAAGLNPYTYALNNPLTFVDPLGLSHLACPTGLPPPDDKCKRPPGWAKKWLRIVWLAWCLLEGKRPPETPPPVQPPPIQRPAGPPQPTGPPPPPGPPRDPKRGPPGS